MFKPNNREFQAGLNPEDSRRRRQNNSLSLRRQDRESRLQKKRQRILSKDNNKQEAQSSKSQHIENENVFGFNLSKLVQGIMSQHPGTQFECVKQFREMLSKKEQPPIKRVIDCGVIPRFIQLARNNAYPEMQFEALWTLLNVASGPAECVAAVIRNGSHNVFIDLLNKSPLYDIQEQSMWACGNIAGDGIELKNLLLQHGILDNILPIVCSKFDAEKVSNFNRNAHVAHDPFYGYLALLNTTSWTLSNLCRSSPPPNEKMMEDLIKCLGILMKKCMDMSNEKYLVDKEEILGNIGWAFSYLTGFDNASNRVIERMGHCGIIQQFVNFMDYDKHSIRHPTNRVIGNILSGSDENTQNVLKMGILPKFKSLLVGNLCKSKEKKEICWCLSNICAGPIGDRLKVLECGLFPILIDMLKNSPFDIQKEALWTLSNASTEPTQSIIGPLVEMGLICAICSFLTKNMTYSHNKSDKMLTVALECIENVLIVGNMHLCANEPNKFAKELEEYGGLQYLEELQADDENVSDAVYTLCVEIITKYLGGEDDGGMDDNNNVPLDYGDFGTMRSGNNGQNDNSTNFSFGVNSNKDSFQF